MDRKWTDATVMAMVRNRAYYGLYVPKGLWREMENVSTNSLALVLSSTKYDESDYIYEYDEFVKLKQDGKI